MVLGAAGDASWRVRLKVAEALAGYGDRDGAAAARRLLDDPSAEVERQVVRSLAAWPWEMAGPVLLDALGKDAVTVRKLAAEQIAARWPAGGRFPFEAPPRAEGRGPRRVADAISTRVRRSRKSKAAAPSRPRSRRSP